MSDFDSTDLPDPSSLSTAEMFKLILESQKRVEDTVKEQANRVLQLESEVKILKCQVYDLQNTVNKSEQELRKNTVRITGFPFTEEEKASTDSKYLAKKVYDRILQPMLHCAKNATHIDKVTKLDNTVEGCFRLRTNTPTGTGRPPPIILKFSNEQIKIGVFKVKRLNTPPPTQEEKDMGIQKFNLVEDLTPQAYSKLREIQREEVVERAWTVNGRIKFVVRGNQRIHTVKSVYDPVPDILSKI